MSALGSVLVARLAAVVVAARIDPTVTIGVAGGRRAQEHLDRILDAVDAVIAHHQAEAQP